MGMRAARGLEQTYDRQSTSAGPLLVVGRQGQAFRIVGACGARQILTARTVDATNRKKMTYRNAGVQITVRWYCTGTILSMNT